DVAVELFALHLLVAEVRDEREPVERAHLLARDEGRARLERAGDARALVAREERAPSSLDGARAHVARDDAVARDVLGGAADARSAGGEEEPTGAPLARRLLRRHFLDEEARDASGQIVARD